MARYRQKPDTTRSYSWNSNTDKQSEGSVLFLVFAAHLKSVSCSLVEPSMVQLHACIGIKNHFK